jgi:hypothetical protein
LCLDTEGNHYRSVSQPKGPSSETSGCVHLGHRLRARIDSRWRFLAWDAAGRRRRPRRHGNSQPCSRRCRDGSIRWWRPLVTRVSGGMEPIEAAQSSHPSRVSVLRSLLGDECLPGFALRPGSALAEPDPRIRIQLPQAKPGLLAGGQLPVFSYEAFTRQGVGLIETFRLITLEKRIEAEAEAGGCSNVVTELARDVVANPSRGRPTRSPKARPCRAPA